VSRASRLTPESKSEAQKWLGRPGGRPPKSSTAPAMSTVESFRDLWRRGRRGLLAVLFGVLSDLMAGLASPIHAPLLITTAVTAGVAAVGLGLHAAKTTTGDNAAILGWLGVTAGLIGVAGSIVIAAFL